MKRTADLERRARAWRLPPDRARRRGARQSGSPEMTVWSGALRLAATTVPCVSSRALGARKLDFGGAEPEHRRHRAGTRLRPPRASARRGDAPAWPRPLPPAHRWQPRPSIHRANDPLRRRRRRVDPATTESTAAECARIAGCALCVSVSSSSGPSHINRVSAGLQRRVDGFAASRAPPENARRGPSSCRPSAHPDRERAAPSPPDDHARPGEPGAERRPASRSCPGLSRPSASACCSASGILAELVLP